MTDTPVHRNVERVIAAGAELGVPVAPVTFPEGTKTAADAAAAIGCELGQIVKSLIFGVEHDGAVEVVLAYVSGANQLDERKLAEAAGGHACQRVDADAVRTATGFPDTCVDDGDGNYLAAEPDGDPLYFRTENASQLAAALADAAGQVCCNCVD